MLSLIQYLVLCIQHEVKNSLTPLSRPRRQVPEVVSSSCIILNLNIAVVCLINKRALQKIWKKKNSTLFRGRYVLTYKDALHFKGL